MAVATKGKTSSTETTFSLRRPPYTYLHLSLKQIQDPEITTVSPVDLDDITARSYLTAALQQFLGLTGTAIQIDLLKVEGRNIWLRVAREDGSAVVAAMSQWANQRQGISLKVNSRGEWLGGVMAKGKMGEDLWTMKG